MRAIVLTLITLFAVPAGAQEVSFNRDVRPILSARCFACHGPDADHREAGLRLDVAEAAHEMGVFDGEPSAVVERLLSGDEDEVMPPPHAGKPLTGKEKKILAAWVKGGAKYEKHWAFERPQKPDVPPADSWCKNEIDRFVARRLKANGIEASPAADKYTLVRRLYLDLIGLVPTPAQADAFVNSDDPQIYRQTVDQLLASPRYGEHWARAWLDLARYADTNGYEKDRERSIWPWRDWVIRSLNADKPYDQFTIEQLAGDMLPDATADQTIATGFHRNTMLNEEGGIDPREYRYLAMVDRVATTGTVWMGLTTGCAQCHTHKYDPISHTDYFRVMALLNNADEPDFEIENESTEKRRKEILKQIAEKESGLWPTEPSDELKKAFEEWKDRQRESAAVKWVTPKPTSLAAEGVRLKFQADRSIFASGDAPKRDLYGIEYDLKSGASAIRIRALPDSRLPAHGPGLSSFEGPKGDFYVSELKVLVDGKAVPLARSTVSFNEAKGGDVAKVFDGNGSSGWRPGSRIGSELELVVTTKEALPAGKVMVEMLFERHYPAGLGRFEISFADSANAIADNPSLKFDLDDEGSCRNAFAKVTSLLVEARKPIDELRKKLPARSHTLVMQERPEDFGRKTHRHHRGEWLKPREEVSPWLPELFESEVDRQPANRLEFAKWLVSKDNPLAARVAVNRAWRAFFGAGLVRTPGDFGVQCESPTHPQLLDWLAVDLMDNGWSLKRLHRQIVTSATYRQRSAIDAESLNNDAPNRLLGRATKFRLAGEVVRDSMLVGSGLLSTKMYGRGVFPPQPQSVTALSYGSYKWRPSTGEDRYRRSIYTFAKRTASFAAYSVFDGPSGETCTARRGRSNTPLQALTLLNDEMYLEMARHLAKDKTRDDIKSVFRQVLTRPASEDEVESLSQYFDAQLARLASGELKAGEVLADEKGSDIHAAMSMVARVIMNLDEAITRQ